MVKWWIVLLAIGGGCLSCDENSTDSDSGDETEDTSSSLEDSDTGSDAGVVVGSCDDAVTPYHYCEGANLIQFTGDMTQTANACVFTVVEIACSYDEGCIENADTDDVCWNPCNGVVCDTPPEDECVDASTLNSYNPELPLTGGVCLVITAGAGDPEPQCQYVSVQVPCETECITVDDGSDYCAQ